jgi:hypothetical protein
MSYYIALFRQGQGGEWQADFPDFPHCQASGLNFDLASSAAAMALRQCTSGGEVSLPRPSSLSDIEGDASLRSNYGSHLEKAIISLIPLHR